MAKKTPPKPKKLSPAQKAARVAARKRMLALNAERRTAANVIANDAARAAKRTAARLNRNKNRTAAVQTQKRFDSSDDGQFF